MQNGKWFQLKLIFKGRDWYTDFLALYHLELVTRPLGLRSIWKKSRVP